MTRLLQSFRRRWTLRAYRRRLGPALRKRYGKQTTYTPGQVRRTAYETGCPVQDLCFAYSMYCSRVILTRIMLRSEFSAITIRCEPRLELICSMGTAISRSLTVWTRRRGRTDST